jgi:hypothetical protein
LTEMDRVILKLNNEQHMTSSQIKKTLPMYGMELSITAICDHLKEMRNNPSLRPN